MMLVLRFFPTAALFAMLLPVCGFGPASNDGGAPPDILVTAAPVYAPLAALQGKERFPLGAQLLLVHDGKAEPLIPSFFASADPSVSFDGERVLFAGKHSPRDAWQIWEITLKDRSLRKVIAGDGNAVRPLYLPYGRLVYARQTSHGFRLEAAGKDQTDGLAAIDPHAADSLQPISFFPGNALPDDVLSDGRILFEAGFPLGTDATPEMYLVYSDGSGVESYRCDHGKARWGGKQLASGDVIFSHGPTLARFTSPLAHEAAVVAPRAEYAGGVAEAVDGSWLLSARTAGLHRVLVTWQAADGEGQQSEPLKQVLAVDGEDLVEPVIVAPRPRPRRHPTALHPWNYANMMALDARISRDGDLKSVPAKVRLEAMDAHGRATAMGTAPVDADGSFLVRTPADTPIRFALLDAKGSVIRAEHGWFWIRAGEQRYCVGCHAGPERSSDNHVPAVLLRTTIPVDLTGHKPDSAARASVAGGN